MLCYKNHRFHYGKISFQIPDGYYIDTEPELISDNSLHLHSPDKLHRLDLQVDTSSKGAAKELASVLKDMKHTLLQPTSRFTLNGLSGVHASYKADGNQYYEAWLDIAKGVSMLILISTKRDIAKIDTAAILTAVDLRENTN